MNNIEDRPKVGIGVYVIKDGKLLLGERIGAHQANTFSAPGGHLEYGESWEDCARRETSEETGIEIQNIRFLGITNDIMKDDNRHYITIAMIADYLSGTPTNLEPKKCLGWKWYSFDKIPEKQSKFLENFLKSEFSAELRKYLK